jgi:hypothetical protein
MPRIVGFVEQEKYDRLKAAATELWLGAILATAYTFAFHGGGLLGMKVGQVDPNRRGIQLEAHDTKCREPRLVIMTQEIHDLVHRWESEKTAMMISGHKTRNVFDR